MMTVQRMPLDDVDVVQALVVATLDTFATVGYSAHEVADWARGFVASEGHGSVDAFIDWVIDRRL
jgi:hypothetical protein